MARPNRNGAEKSAHNTPRKAKSLRANMAREPLGDPPKDLTKDEKKAWQMLAADFKWIDRSHRTALRNAVILTVRVLSLSKYFYEREDEFAKRGDKKQHAILGDDGKHHPLFVILMRSQTDLTKALSELGSTHATKLKLLSQFGDERGKVEDEESQMRFLR